MIARLITKCVFRFVLHITEEFISIMDRNPFCESISFACIVVMSRQKRLNLSYYAIIFIRISFSTLESSSGLEKVTLLTWCTQPFNLQPLFQKNVEKWFQKSGSSISDFFSGQPLFSNQKKFKFAEPLFSNLKKRGFME